MTNPNNVAQNGIPQTEDSAGFHPAPQGSSKLRTQTIFTMIVIALALGYVMRDSIEESVLLPLSYFFWVLGIYYSSFPQAVTWIFLIVIVALLAVGSLAGEPPDRRRAMEKSLPLQGPVESLAGWIVKARSGIYFKWLVAQRLGLLARALVNFQSRRSASPSAQEPLGGPGWDPPEEVAAYLESGLNGSFADYPQPRWSFRPPPPTPLDIDPKQVIEFIESEVRRT
jgi:hypothetical protein